MALQDTNRKGGLAHPFFLAVTPSNPTSVMVGGTGIEPVTSGL